MTAERNETIFALALRAAAVIMVVLAVLTCLAHYGVTVEEHDAPMPTVEQYTSGEVTVAEQMP